MGSFFFPRTFFCWSKRSQCSATARLASLHRRRLAMGGGMAESTRTSLRAGGSPSTLAAPPSGSDRRLAAKVRAAAKEMGDDQRSVKAEVAAARQVAGTARARQRASKQTKLAASLLQRPPTLVARQLLSQCFLSTSAFALWRSFSCIQPHANLPRRCCVCCQHAAPIVSVMDV